MKTFLFLGRLARLTSPNILYGNKKIVEEDLERHVTWLTATYNLMDHCYQSLSVDITTMVSKKCPNIGQQVIAIFVDIIG